MLLSVILTTKGRGPQALQCIERLLETTRPYKIEVVIVAYPEPTNLDTFTQDVMDRLGDNIVLTWMDDRSIPCYNYGASLAKGTHLMGLDDDAWFPDDWFQALLETIENTPNQNGYFKIQSDNQCYWAERAVASREFLIEHLGGVLCIPSYISQYDDVEKTDRAMAAGLFFESNAYIEHRHWSHGKAEIDATYKAGGISHCDRDRTVYNDRKSKGFPNNYEKSISSI